MTRPQRPRRWPIGTSPSSLPIFPRTRLLKAADAVRDRGAVLFNAGAIDDRLREEDCRANVIHVAPTRSMLADGLGSVSCLEAVEALADGGRLA